MSSRACSQRGRECFLGAVLLSLAFVVLLQPRPAAAQLSTSDPVGFFTNLSSRLLQAEFGLSLNQIQVDPTNQYTPAVHRLLQVTANLWETQTNIETGLPVVFRPRFSVTNSAVYISSYVLVTNVSELASLPLLDLTSSNAASLIPPDGNALLFGVPLVVGARKGLPNFNEFAMDTLFTLGRKVELRKSGPGSQIKIVETNQLYTVNISVACGAEFWNSYRSNYTKPVTIVVNSRLTISLVDGNYPGSVPVSKTVVVSGTVSTNSLGGWKGGVADGSFIVPLRTNINLFTPSTIGYLPGSGSFFDPVSVNFEVDARLLFPNWYLSISNRVQAMVLDAAGRIIDYVLLGDMTCQTNMTQIIGQASTSIGFNGLWGTNTSGGQVSGRPGVLQQMLVSRGNFSGTPPNDWVDGYGTFPGNRAYEIAKFGAFFLPFGATASFTDPWSGATATASNTNLVAVAPFIPIVTFLIPMSWQANDPLVHYMSRDMLYVEKSGYPAVIRPSGSANNFALDNTGVKNERYQPWPTDPGVNKNLFDISIKDPLIRSSDDWDFPTNASLAIETLGRVHRGTPWQTLYLKSSDMGFTNQILSMSGWLNNLNDTGPAQRWSKQTGNPNLAEGFYTRPARDWSLVALISSLINTNDPRQLLSINDPNQSHWLETLDGLIVLTNTSTAAQLLTGAPPQFQSLTLSSNSTQTALLVQGIAGVRANQPGQVFCSIGGLLATAELSMASPWLNRSSSLQTIRGITDEAYEKIPSELLSRVRADSVGSVLHNGTAWQIQFTGFDNYAYAVESSTNLVNWTSVSTNYPTNGVFTFTDSAGGAERFYRSVLLP